MRRHTIRPLIGLFTVVTALLFCASTALGQTATVARNVNLRPDQSPEYPPIRLLTPSEPPLSLLDVMPESGYYHVKTTNGEEVFRLADKPAIGICPYADGW